jgi:hypothetical protein
MDRQHQRCEKSFTVGKKRQSIDQRLAKLAEYNDREYTSINNLMLFSLSAQT